MGEKEGVREGGQGGDMTSTGLPRAQRAENASPAQRGARTAPEGNVSIELMRHNFALSPVNMP